jgi:hypothetical protein
MSMSRLVLALTVTMVLAVGCATPSKPQVEQQPGATLGGYRTFHLLPLPDRIPGADPGAMVRIGETVRETTQAGFEAKGYRPAAAESADFAVAVRGEVVPKVNVTDWGYVPGPAAGWRRYPVVYRGYRDIDVEQYQEGTIAVEVYDRASKNLVWVSWLQGRTVPRAKEVEKVRTALQSIIAGFPAARP